MSTEPEAFDANRAWTLDGQVSVRPERFGGLLYHFGTRRLSFVKTPTLLRAVEQLAAYPSAVAALEAAGVRAEEMPSYTHALAGLAATRMISPRGAA